jgi:two-component system LytT family sensor kinase
MHSFGLSWQTSLIDSAVNNIFLAFGCFIISMTLRWYQPNKKKSLLLIGWVIILAAKCVWLSNLVLEKIFVDDPSYLSLLDRSLLIRFSISLLVITWVTLVRWIYNTMLVKQEDEDRKINAEKLLKEAELTGLRQQLQPHFLFNSLNSISALAGTKPEESRKMIQQLSDFLRYFKERRPTNATAQR